MQPHAQAENYVVKIEGKDILKDFVIGAKPSLEVHYHALVMAEDGKEPPEIDICADVFAMNDKGVIAKTPTCQKLSKFIAHVHLYSVCLITGFPCLSVTSKQLTIKLRVFFLLS